VYAVHSVSFQIPFLRPFRHRNATCGFRSVQTRKEENEILPTNMIYSHLHFPSSVVRVIGQV